MTNVLSVVYKIQMQQINSPKLIGWYEHMQHTILNYIVKAGKPEEFLRKNYKMSSQITKKKTTKCLHSQPQIAQRLCIYITFFELSWYPLKSKHVYEVSCNLNHIDLTLVYEDVQYQDKVIWLGCADLYFWYK